MLRLKSNFAFVWILLASFLPNNCRIIILSPIDLTCKMSLGPTPCGLILATPKPKRIKDHDQAP